MSGLMAGARQENDSVEDEENVYFASRLFKTISISGRSR